MIFFVMLESHQGCNETGKNRFKPIEIIWKGSFATRRESK